MIDKELLINPFKPEEDEKPRYHYNGYHVMDDGKTIRIGVRTPDDQYGQILLPFEEIDTIRRIAWENIENAAKEKMKGKRVHCSHKVSFHAFMPECCQIGLNNGPHDVNCVGCKFIDGYIEEYNPDDEYKVVDDDEE